MPEGYNLPEIFILTKIIEFWANPLFLSQIKILILFGSRRKLVISVGKRRGFSRRFWLLIKELFRDKKIARDTGKRNRTPYINVSFLEFDFLESHRLLDNPLILPQTKILISFWSLKAENQKFEIEEKVMSGRVKMPNRHFLRSDYLHFFFYLKFLVFVSLVPQISSYCTVHEYRL